MLGTGLTISPLSLIILLVLGLSLKFIYFLDDILVINKFVYFMNRI
jgi:hypothetical protein